MHSRPRYRSRHTVRGSRRLRVCPSRCCAGSSAAANAARPCFFDPPKSRTRCLDRTLHGFCGQAFRRGSTTLQAQTGASGTSVDTPPRFFRRCVVPKASLQRRFRCLSALPAKRGRPKDALGLFPESARHWAGAPTRLSVWPISTGVHISCKISAWRSEPRCLCALPVRFDQTGATALQSLGADRHGSPDQGWAGRSPERPHR